MNGMTRIKKNISYVLKVIVILSAVIGTIMSALGGRDAFMSGGTVFMYFTIQSNIAIAVICLIGCCLLMRRRPVNTVWKIIKFVGTVAITLTGVVFAFVLAPTLGNEAWNV